MVRPYRGIRLTAVVKAAVVLAFTTLVAVVWATGAGVISQKASAEAQNMYTTTCATCHGTDGEGDGPASFGLATPPQDYSDKEWQKSVTNREIMEAILFGGSAVGLSPDMRANPVLRNKPEVLAALAQIVRNFAGVPEDPAKLLKVADEVVKEAKPHKNMSKQRRAKR